MPPRLAKAPTDVIHSEEIVGQIALLAFGTATTFIGLIDAKDILLGFPAALIVALTLSGSSNIGQRHAQARTDFSACAGAIEMSLEACLAGLRAERGQGKTTDR